MRAEFRSRRECNLRSLSHLALNPFPNYIIHLFKDYDAPRKFVRLLDGTQSCLGSKQGVGLPVNRNPSCLDQRDQALNQHSAMQTKCLFQSIQGRMPVANSFQDEAFEE